MTNEDLKNKICDIIAPYVSAYGDDERIADALILEGIGYVWDITEKAEKAIASLIKQNKKLQHRAARAERALRNALNNDTCYFCNEKIHCRCEHRDWGSDECIKSLLQQAEKELAEERKDD